MILSALLRSVHGCLLAKWHECAACGIVVAVPNVALATACILLVAVGVECAASTGCTSASIIARATIPVSIKTAIPITVVASCIVCGIAATSPATAPTTATAMADIIATAPPANTGLATAFPMSPIVSARVAEAGSSNATGMDDLLNSAIEQARLQLINSMNFVHMLYGTWQVKKQDLHLADLVLNYAMKMVSNGWGSIRLRADAFALFGLRLLYWPDAKSFDISDKQALHMFETAVMLNTSAAFVRIAYGAALYKFGTIDDLSHFFGGGVAQVYTAAGSELVQPAADAGEPVAWLLLASNAAMEGRTQEAAAAARTALALAPEDVSVMDAAGQMLRTWGSDLESEAIFARGVNMGVWPSTDQRPLIYFKDLRRLPHLIPSGIYPALDQTLAALDLAVPAMRRDLDVVMTWLVDAAHWSRAQRSHLLDARRNTTGLWFERKIFHCLLAKGEACERDLMPTLCDTLARLSHGSTASSRSSSVASPPPSYPVMDCSGDLRTHGAPNPLGVGLRFVQATFSVVGPPFTYIDWHSSAEHGRLRLLCPLYVPSGSTSVMRFRSGDTIEYREGSCFWFDESIEHSVVYTGTGYRVSVLVDVLHPDLQNDAGERQDVIIRQEPLSTFYFVECLKRWRRRGQTHLGR
eukprot:TRINITY_DN44542_c0_g1_i1.p1 TRINITY_DN44542_c0_g1~~TRINITY_DN44542_c0_g1_i1.p1  ORF type:complete len:639 (-),score=66.68 TRINITY_DN44542_c0_g1_i1:20-1936(-)